MDIALTETEILKIVGAELSDSVGGSENDSIDKERRNALAAYLGDKGETQEGRSEVVSTDVADAIEWIMPEVVKAFTQNNEIVTFDPVGPDDKDQADLESRFVYDVLMKDNDGFIIIHEFVKDALMQKNGFLKACYVEEDEISKEDYTGLTEPELILLQNNPNVEITGLTEDSTGEIPLYDVNINRTRTNGKIEVRCVAPENFRVNRMHNSVSLKTARFQAESMLKTKSELLEDGFDPDVIDELNSSDNEYHQDKQYRFSMQGEVTMPESGNVGGDESQELYEVSECYMLIDIDGDGISERCKITVAGYSNPTHVLDIEEVDEWPFISATAILMSHKLFGLSIYDRLKEIQKQKTALWRNILDNMYLQNNQRTVVVEGQVNLDDLLISRPGGVIRAKTKGAVEPYVTPALSSDAYRMMDYLDQVRSGRSGVSPEGSIHDSAMGDSVGSEGLDKLLNQKEELVGLMIRVFAETGIKPLCIRIRDLLVQHKDIVADYEFRGAWHKVEPSKWKARKHSTVRVGTGSGNRKQQAAAIMQMLTFQEKMLANPSQAMVSDPQVFAALNDFAKASGMPGASPYFLDPTSPEGQKKKQEVDQSNKQKQEFELKEKQLLATVQQRIAEAETTKAGAAQDKVRADAMLQNQKQEHEAYKTQMEAENKMLKQQLDEAKILIDSEHKTEDTEFKYWDAQKRHEIENRRLDIQEKKNNQSGENDGSQDTSDS